MTQPALFLDRDGVINHEVGYLYRPADVRFLDGIFSLCRTAQRLGYRLVVVTNQSGIARGLYTTQQFEALMTWMGEEFSRQGVTLDGIYHCPFHPVHGIGEFRREHEDRKPGAGMLLRAAGDLDLDLATSILIGDRCTDIAAARTAGLRQAFLIRGTEKACEGEPIEIDLLSEAEDWLKVRTATR